MQKLAPETATYIIIHAVKSKDYMKGVAHKLRIEDFDAQLEYAPMLFWAVIHKYWKTHGECIPLPFLKLELQQALLDENITSIEEQGLIWALYNDIEAFPAEAVEPREMIELTQRFLQVRRTSSKISALQHGDIPKVLKDIEQLTREIELTAVKPMDLSKVDMRLLFDGKPRNPTGVPIIDELLSGGTKPGEIYGFIGPVGGGKTTTAHTLIVNGARRKRHVALFSYEEGGDDVLRRIHIANAGINRNFVESRPLSEIPENVLEKLIKSGEAINPYVHYFDMTAQHGGIDELATCVQDLCDNGMKPELICVDWVGEMAAKWLMGQNKDAEGNLLRMGIGRMVAGALELSKKLQIPIFLFHQLNKDKCAKDPKHVPQWMDSQDARNFADLLQYCFVLGVGQVVKLDDREVMIAWLNLSKARGLPKKKSIVEIDGAYCRIRKPKQEWIISEHGNGFELAEGASMHRSIASVM